MTLNVGEDASAEILLVDVAASSVFVVAALRFAIDFAVASSGPAAAGVISSVATRVIVVIFIVFLF